MSVEYFFFFPQGITYIWADVYCFTFHSCLLLQLNRMYWLTTKTFCSEGIWNSDLHEVSQITWKMSLSSLIFLTIKTEQRWRLIKICALITHLCFSVSDNVKVYKTYALHSEWRHSSAKGSSVHSCLCKHIIYPTLSLKSSDIMTHFRQMSVW